MKILNKRTTLGDEMASAAMFKSISLFSTDSKCVLVPVLAKFFPMEEPEVLFMFEFLLPLFSSKVVLPQFMKNVYSFVTHFGRLEGQLDDDLSLDFFVSILRTLHSNLIFGLP
uniref:Uncharacterized protein n=1 Tax=Romanomermis culicivorax TaxID=13658 RepID=A0A915KWE1_ROMCU